MADLEWARKPKRSLPRILVYALALANGTSVWSIVSEYQGHLKRELTSTREHGFLDELKSALTELHRHKEISDSEYADGKQAIKDYLLDKSQEWKMEERMKDRELRAKHEWQAGVKKQLKQELESRKW